ncbi:MAG: hypothetical protein ACP5NP_06715 [Acetobacteraceae bacterium]
MSSSISGSDRPELPPGRFLTLAAAAFAGVFALVWLWVAAMPLAYLDPEYPAWLAKERLLAACRVGDVLVLGDSRAAADLIPRRLPGHVVNLAVGGGEPIEAYSALRRALACPRPPRRVIVSFDAVHFVRPDLFWARSVAFGFEGPRALARLRHVSRATGDFSVWRLRLPRGEPGRLRAALYAARFPTLYFGPLLHGGIALRWFENRRRLRRVLAARGHYYFGRAAGSAVIAAEGTLRRFHPAPVLDWYFRTLLRLARAHRVPVTFVAMPINTATWRAVRPRVRRGFAAYLAALAARDPGFRVQGGVMPHWPDRWFGDAFSHLNPAGAARFSARFAAVLAQRPRKTGRRFSMKEAVASR